jgi:Gas vesicle synthesis protein GvpO
MKTNELVRRTREQVAELTGYKPETISSISRIGEGWQAVVEVVELKRVPETSDVLGSYEVQLDAAGDVQTYRRVRRYQRSQMSEN